MRDNADKSTIDMFPVPKKMGRPSTGKAKTDAERQAMWRARKKNKPKENFNVWIENQTKARIQMYAAAHKLSLDAALDRLIEFVPEQHFDYSENCNDE
ncbi:MAG: hypothetical protein PHY54_18580 [Methylococcales bacterium]|nr:hypothetical protein [Methylococcales bacterium]